VHVKIGDDEVVSPNVPVPGPPVTAQEKPTVELLPLPSIPAAESKIDPPTSTCSGLAERLVTCAQSGGICGVTMTPTDPLLPPSAAVPRLHNNVTFAELVWFATMLNVPEPRQFMGLGPSVVAVSVIV
jgi:hypothetical protein